MCQSLFLNKVAGLKPATFLKKRLWHGSFPVNFEKFLRAPFLQNTFGRLNSESPNFLTIFTKYLLSSFTISIHHSFRYFRYFQLGVHSTSWGEGGKNNPTSFSSLTSANVRIGPQNSLTFYFNPFATSLHLVPVPNY